MTDSRAALTGFHYFPDSAHYTNGDLQRWLPRLRDLGALTLTLQAPAGRAIPEPFISGLLQAGIQPILQFNFRGEAYPSASTLELLLQAYAGWGIKYIVFFDRPNRRRAWPANFWAQNDLVERFLDLYLPLVELAANVGLTPVFPPLEPGGDYWDTAFLRAALQGLTRRAGAGLAQSLALGAWACQDGHPLSWGAGGPERWPGARPYSNLPELEDQRGFYIFDWYNALSGAILGNPLPVMLFGVDNPRVPPENAAQTLYPILSGAPAPAPLPENLLGANIYCLSARPEQAGYKRAWFEPDGSPRPAAESALSWRDRNRKTQMDGDDRKIKPAPELNSSFPIRHYLLLPTYEWGIAEWQLDVIRPFIIRHQPTVGFSPKEAALAQRVTVIGGDEVLPDVILANLEQEGRRVERISGDGTRIATELENC